MTNSKMRQEQSMIRRYGKPAVDTLALALDAKQSAKCPVIVEEPIEIIPETDDLLTILIG